MTQNKYLFVVLALIILGVFIFLGYVYYDSTRPLKEMVPPYKTTPNIQEAKTQEPLSHINVAIIPAITKTTTTKQDYQPTETERVFYRPVIESLKPKQILRNERDLYWIGWIRETYKAFPPREPYPADAIALIQTYANKNKPEEIEMIKMLRGKIEQRVDSVSASKRYYQEMVMNLSELVKQCPDSPYYPDYQETFNLIIQMQKEDELFYDKYAVREPYSSLVLPDVHPDTMPLDEKINAYIHCLRYSYFYKLNERYAMEFGDGMQILMFPNKQPILSGSKLVGIGIPAVPSLLNLLEDRRPIIAVDEDKIPSRFYRYQDAAIEILQRMFNKNKHLFPIEIPQDQYFSEYLEKQTPQEHQNTINYIKKWVEETIANYPKQEETPEEPK